jgi:hypothetical protein
MVIVVRYSFGMTEPTEAHDIIDHGVTDVLQEDEIVQVPPSAADLAEQSELSEIGTFITDVPNWDEPLPLESTER